MGGEQYKKSHEYKELDPREVAELESVAHEKRAEQLESRSPERSIEKGHERERALELANSMERRDTDKNERESRAHDSPAERRRHTPNTKERDVAYHSIMDNARTHMSPVERTFSKVIHSRGVEAVSETVASTVARPNALLAGSSLAFVSTLVVYLVANYYGYPLSGTEAIAAFVFGWILGLLYDYLRAMITGSR